ncbi:hypothetical protein G6F40_015603 [Rhizopus arrhizus]|nr:hypothetical protein G6F40_015603 [Rhizopus arrhizus]
MAKCSLLRLLSHRLQFGAFAAGSADFSAVGKVLFFAARRQAQVLFAQQDGREDGRRCVLGNLVGLLQIHRYDRLESLVVKGDAGHAAHHDASAFDRGARLEAAYVIEIGR